MPKKILIVKWGAIGDVIMTLPMIYKIKEKYPQHKLCWLIGNSVKPLIEHLEIVDQLISFSEKDLFQRGLFSKFFTLCKFWRKIAFRKYEKIYILHKDLRYTFIPFFSFGKKVRLVQNKNFFPNIYHTKQYLSLIDPKAKVKYPKVTYPLNEEFSEVFSKRPCIFLAPGGATNPLQTTSLKRWPISHYVTLCKELLLKGFTIAVIGSDTDKWVVPYFSKLPIKNLVGKTSLLDLLALFHKGELLVTHDTGVMHLAKLSSIKICGMFGPTNPFEFAPTTRQMMTMQGGQGLTCSPCYNGRAFSDCQENLCMKKLSPLMVLEKVLDSCI